MHIPEQVDVLVVGAGASGIPAAIGAARAGAKVLLVEDDPVPGGAAVDQYVSMLSGGPRSGVVSEILARLEQDHALTRRPVDRWWDFWYLPSDVMRVGFNAIRAEANLQFRCPARIRQLTVGEQNGRPCVTGAMVPGPDGSEQKVLAHVVIEATGEGQLAEQAGCEALYGEDARDDFGEALAPERRTNMVQQCTWMFISQRRCGATASDDWTPRGMESGLGGSHKPARQRCPDPPAHLYLHWGSRVDCADTRDPYALAEAQWEALDQMRPKLDEFHRHGWTVHLAPRIGVREIRRIVGEHVITANDLIEGHIPEDSVLVTQRGFDLWRKGRHQMQGYPEVQPYGIPYRSLVPRGVDGLLVVGKCLSGTHLAMCAYRTQALLGQVGQAAGVAAALCALRHTRPRDIDFGDLKPLLTDPPQNMVISSDPQWVDHTKVFRPRPEDP